MSGFYGGDYGIFITLADYWAQKGDIYTGLFDNKGPYHFLVNVVGISICRDKWGVFLLEVLSLTVCLELCWRIGNTLGVRPWLNVVGTLISLLFLSVTIGTGATVEEWSLPFVLWPLYLCIKYIATGKAIHPLKYSFAYGFSFGVISLMRVNDAAIIVGIVLGLSYILVRRKQYGQIFRNAAWVIAGTFVAVLPALLYFAIKGSLYDMLFATFIYNIKYKDVWEIGTGSRTTNLLRMGLLMFATISAHLYSRKTKIDIFPVVLCGSVVTFLTFINGTAALRYMVMLMPFVYLLCVTLPYYQRYLIPVVVAVILYSWWCGWSVQQRLHTMLHPSEQVLTPESSQVLPTLQAYVPGEAIDSIYTLDIDVMYTDMLFHHRQLPVGKYYTQQTKISSLMPFMAEDIIENFDKANPKWVVSSVEIGETVLKEGGNHYRLAGAITGPSASFYLYRRKQ